MSKVELKGPVSLLAQPSIILVSHKWDKAFEFFYVGVQSSAYMKNLLSWKIKC